MKAKIVLVRPVYPENIGLVARAMANFGFGELCLVRPECGWKGEKAKSRAMHGKGVLLRAREFGSIREALKGCTYAIATSAKKGGKRNAMAPEKIAETFDGGNAKIALVFGSEPSGLTNEEMAECDLLCTIPASEEYGTLNLSHSVAIILYAIFSHGKKRAAFESASSATKGLLLKSFEKGLGAMQGIDDKRAVRASFKALCSRALVSEKEAMALVAFLSGAGKSIKSRQKRAIGPCPAGKPKSKQKLKRKGKMPGFGQ
jgi:tRNA/rRNA methyltransferase